jgi:hypothetical protein
MVVKFYSIIIFTLLCFCLNGQEVILDSIHYNDGRLKVINLGAEKELYPDGVPRNTTVFQELDYYDSSGKLLRQSRYLGQKRVLSISWDTSGQMSSLTYRNDAEKLSVRIYWSKEGEVVMDRSKTGNLILEKVFSESKNFIFSIREYSYVSGQSKSIEFQDSLTGQYWTEVEYKENDLVKDIFEITFDETGKVESCGKFEERYFNVFASEEAFQEGKSPIKSYREKWYKVGEWVIFLENFQRVKFDGS